MSVVSRVERLEAVANVGKTVTLFAGLRDPDEVAAEHLREHPEDKRRKLVLVCWRPIGSENEPERKTYDGPDPLPRDEPKPKEPPAPWGWPAAGDPAHDAPSMQPS